MVVKIRPMIPNGARLMIHLTAVEVASEMFSMTVLVVDGPCKDTDIVGVDKCVNRVGNNVHQKVFEDLCNTAWRSDVGSICTFGKSQHDREQAAGDHSCQC